MVTTKCKPTKNGWKRKDKKGQSPSIPEQAPPIRFSNVVMPSAILVHRATRGLAGKLI